MSQTRPILGGGIRTTVLTIVVEGYKARKESEEKYGDERKVANQIGKRIHGNVFCVRCADDTDIVISGVVIDHILPINTATAVSKDPCTLTAGGDVRRADLIANNGTIRRETIIQCVRVKV